MFYQIDNHVGYMELEAAGDVTFFSTPLTDLCHGD